MMDSSLGHRPVVEVPEFDGNVYRKAVLSGMLSAGVSLEDPFLLVGLDPSEPAADDTAALRTRLADVFGFWQREGNSPRYKGLVAELLRHRSELENVLLDPINRREARTRLAAATGAATAKRRGRVTQLVQAVAQRHGGVPRSRLVLLQRLADREGMPTEELAEILGQHRIIEDGGGVEALTPAVRRMIRATLDELRLRGDKVHSGSLWAYLGLTTAADDAALVARYDVLAEENQRRAFDRDKTVHADVLALVKEHLLSPGPRGRALAALLLDAQEVVQDRVLEQALVDAELFPHDVDQLVDSLIQSGLGLSVEQARSVVRLAATASGISVTTGAAVCAKCGGAARGAAAPSAPTALSAPPAVPAQAAPPVVTATAPAAPTAFAAPRPTAPAALAAPAAAPAAPPPAKGSAEDEWRQLEREVTMRRLVAAAGRAGRLARTHPTSTGPLGQTPGERQAELLKVLETARATVNEAMQRTEPVERERAIYAVLELVADLDEVQEALVALPLPAVTDLVVTVSAGEALLSWQPSESSRTVTYTVMRVVRAADGQHLEHRVGTTTSTSLTDPGLPGTGIVSWEVVAQSAGRRSHATTTEPRPLVPDVTTLRAATGSAGITLSWADTVFEDNQAALVVERTVLPPSEGPLRRTRVRGSRWTDADVHEGVTYRYVVRVERAVDGIVARTPGCTVDVTLGGKPAPVIDLAATLDGEQVRLGWSAPDGVVVAIMASDVPLGPVGEDLDLEVFDRIARRVDGAVGSGEVVDVPRSAVTIYTPVTEHEQRGLLGQALRHVGLKPVSDLVADDTGRVITLRWGFPRGCTQATVGWRRDRPPTEVHDVEQSMLVSLHDVQVNGWQVAAGPEDPRPWFFVVSPVAVLPGENVHGPGSVVALRTA